MANINPSPIKVEAKNFRLNDDGSLSVDIERELVIQGLEDNKKVERSTKREAADGIGEPKEGYLAEDVEFDIYFGGTKITEYTERFYYKVIDGPTPPQDKLTPINVLLSRSTSNPCLDLSSNNLVSITLYYDKKFNSPFNKSLYTQQVKENESAEPYRWTATDSNDNRFQWAQFPDSNDADKYFYKINFPPDDIDPSKGAGAEIGNANSDRKSCNITRETYPIKLFIGKNYSTNSSLVKNMVCTPSVSTRGGTFTRLEIDAFVLENPNSDTFDLYQQILYEEDGVTPIHPIQLNTFGATTTKNFTVKVADDDVAPYYYLAESTVTTPLFKDTPCYRVGNQLGLCFVDPNEEDPIPLTDCDIVDNNLRPGSEGGPPEDKTIAVCRGDEYEWNGTQWYLNEENGEDGGTPSGGGTTPSGGGNQGGGNQGGGNQGGGNQGGGNQGGGLPPNRTRGTRSRLPSNRGL